jgi:hypothetical protein
MYCSSLFGLLFTLESFHVSSLRVFLFSTTNAGRLNNEQNIRRRRQNSRKYRTRCDVTVSSFFILASIFRYLTPFRKRGGEDKPLALKQFLFFSGQLIFRSSVHFEAFAVLVSYETYFASGLQTFRIIYQQTTSEIRCRISQKRNGAELHRGESLKPSLAVYYTNAIKKTKTGVKQKATK